MFFSVRKVQDNFQQQVNDLNQKMNRPDNPLRNKSNNNDEGEYVDYEEIK